MMRGSPEAGWMLVILPKPPPETFVFGLLKLT